MTLEPGLMAALREWALGRPEAVQRLMVEWPPFAKVMAREGVNLLVPAPGIVGRVESYFDNGHIGVTAPAQATAVLFAAVAPARPDVQEGEMLRGEVDPAQIELLEYDEITPDDVRAALEETER